LSKIARIALRDFERTEFDTRVVNPQSTAPDEANGNRAEAAIPALWKERWEGSGQHRGWHIDKASRLHNNEAIAYLGPDVSAETVTMIVQAHNAAIAPKARTEAHWCIECGGILKPCPRLALEAYAMREPQQPERDAEGKS